MLYEIDFRDILFLDIETVPQYNSFDSAPLEIQALWQKKAGYIKREDESPEDLYPRSSIYAEFGKIVCISAGVITPGNETYGFRIKSYASENERGLLMDFNKMLVNYTSDRHIYLCAHNGKEFDFPYIARRMLINGIRLPAVLDIAGAKPWEVRHLDTMELWKFGDYKHYTSLELLTAIFGIPSPKEDIDGSRVGEVFWKEKDIKRIVKYCQNDVLAIAQLLLRYKNLPLIDPENVEIV